MAWIESHQDLATNPKARRAARLLDVSLPTMVGHLHMLWWWALDHAFDGDVSEYDALDLADAAGWEGDPETFVDALVDCGPGSKCGFIERSDEVKVIHDWDQFTEPLQKRRKASAKANHVQHHKKKGRVSEDCDFCPEESRSDRGEASDSAPTGGRPEPNRRPDGSAADSTGTLTITKPNQTNTQSPSPSRGDGEPSSNGDNPRWRQILAEHEPDSDELTWDLLSVYKNAGRQVVRDEQLGRGSLIALVADYVTKLTGHPPDSDARSLIAKTVQRNGLIALLGWDKAIGATEEDDPKSQLAYAQAVVNAKIEEIEDG